MEGSPTEVIPVSPVGLAERKIFRDELKPARARSKEAEEFGRLMSQYEIALNAAVWDKDLNGPEGEDLINSAHSVVQMRGLKKRQKPGEDTKSIDESIKGNSKKVADWFTRNFPGTYGLISSYVPKEDTAKGGKPGLDEVIGTTLSHRISLRKLGAAYREELDRTNLEETGRFLLDTAPVFKDLAKSAGKSDSVIEETGRIEAASKVEEETLELDQAVAAFALKDWIAVNSQEARAQGRKIYDTPYYANLLKELHFLGRTKNGVGGVILYGPTGTGKTELIIEKNRQEGFKTRVISIHHYISFADLIADKAIQVGVDKSAPVADRVSKVLDVFGSMTDVEFESDFSSLVERLRAEGQVGKDESAEQFISSFVSEEVGEKIKEQMDWKLVKDDFLRTQRARVLRTALPSSYQEVTEDIIRGEILLAIKNGERVILDELDKAGPNSLGGLLTFLAKSKGETIEYGNASEVIPPWFSIDATSNSTELNEYLANRFSQKRVDVPPIKDQLMIAAVKVADHQGNILLSPHEQIQMSAFFVYMVPEINEVLVADGSPPLSNRDIQHLTSYLVDFDNTKLTGKSFKEAVSSLISGRSVIAKDKQTVQKLDELLQRFSGILKEKPADYREAFDAETTAAKGATFESTLNSPLVNAINGLESPTLENGKPKIKGVSLSPKQIKRIKSFIEKESQEPSARADRLKLPIGFLLEKKIEGGRVAISVTAVPKDDDSFVLGTDFLPQDGKLVASSSDARTVVLLTEKAKAGKDLHSFDVFRSSEAKQVGDAQGGEPVSEVEIDAQGKHLTWLDSKNILYPARRFGQVVRFDLAKDGRTMLIERTDGSSSIVSSDDLSPLVENLPGGGWRFAGDKLLVQVINGTIQNQAFYIA